MVSITRGIFAVTKCIVILAQLLLYTPILSCFVPLPCRLRPSLCLAIKAYCDVFTSKGCNDTVLLTATLLLRHREFPDDVISSFTINTTQRSTTIIAQVTRSCLDLHHFIEIKHSPCLHCIRSS